jgi:hypothetical protein
VRFLVKTAMVGDIRSGIVRHTSVKDP